MRSCLRPTRSWHWAALIALLAPSSLAAQVRALTVDEWRADVKHLAAELVKRHPDPEFRGMRRAAFDSAVAGLDARASGMARHEIIVEMARIVAMLGDAHTELGLTQEAAGFHRYPLQFYWFDGELRVTAAADSLAGLAGRRVVRIGDVSVDTAMARVATLISRDNAQEIIHSGPDYLAYAEVLHALRIASRVDRVTIGLESDDGASTDVELTPMSRAGLAGVTWKNITVVEGHELPLYRRDVSRAYWREYLPESRTLYVQYNQCRDAQDGPSISRFAEELFRFVDANEVDRLVLDMRWNTGGNFHRSRPIVEGIMARPSLNREGRVFVIVGRRTFSAATMTALHLKQETKAMLVGEVSRGNPNGTYNMETMRLPRSRIEVDYTDRLHQPAPEYADRNGLPVDLPVTIPFDAYRSGRDPVLDAILNYRQPSVSRSISAVDLPHAMLRPARSPARRPGRLQSD
jgi:hypothetical protein